jgi:condensin complex subunit 2
MKRVPILANFEEWMKMATDNKINAANSWNFALIDYFHDMSLLKEGDGVNFQKASCTLDGCVKIYTSRVDSVATETGRLLSGLADSADGKGKKNKEAGDDEDGEEGDEDDEDGEGGKKKQKKKPARSHEATLAPSFASLQLRKLELEFAVDPLFKKASADFDEGGAKGLLLNHLSIDSEGRIVFDSSDEAGDASLHSDIIDAQPDEQSGELTAPAQTDPQPEEDTGLDLTCLATKFFPDGLSHLDHLDICPSMKTFALGATDLSIPSFLKPPEDWRDNHKNRDSETPAPPLLDHNLNLAEQTGIFLDGSNAFGDDDFGYDDNEIVGFDINMPENVGFGEGGEAWARDANIEGQLRTVSGELDDNLIDGGDYAVSLERRIRGEKEDEEGLLAYFDKAFNSRAKIGSKQFVTLENWRIQKLQKARSSEGPEGTTRKRKEKEPFEISFTGPMSEGLKELLDAPPVSDKSISLPKGSRKTKGRNLLDKDDEVVDVRRMMRLWIKPKCRVGRRKNGKYGVVDEGFGARGQTQDEEDAEEGRQGDYDANFFADDEQLLPFDGPLPGEDDESDAGEGGEENQFMDAREMLSPPPPGAENDEGIIIQGDDGPVIEGDAAQSQDQLGTQEALPGSFGSQLVTQQGRRLRPEYVNYARTAKKVDVRKLKENMWKGMSDRLMKGLDQAFAHDRQQQQQDVDTDMMDVDELNRPSTPEDTAPPTPKEGQVEEGETMKFTDMISSLQSVYPQQQMKDISTSYCFICLLHLANEKGLVLQGDRWEGEIEGGRGEMGEIWVRRDEGCGDGYEGE